MNWLERFWTGCGHCKNGQECPLVDAKSLDGLQGTGRGQGLALPAIVVFLLPLATAIVCSHLVARMWAGDDAASRAQWQVVGMAGGLVLGIAAAKIMTTIMRRRGRRTNEGA
ncbi:MAG: SoxR reducing system RseC family protein [Planctomycetes bacterium]|nr:SoxR reducing system RseC family protein [Planctomycetota bacterium]